VQQASKTEITRTAADVIVGEMACMTHLPRRASLRVTKPGTILVLRRNIVHVLQRNRTARLVLYPTYRNRALATWLSGGHFFTDLTPDQKQKCVAFLKEQPSSEVEFQQLDPGRVLFHEGSKAEAFYVIYRGHVQVSETNQYGHETVRDYLGPHQHF